MIWALEEYIYQSVEIAEGGEGEGERELAENFGKDDKGDV